MKNKHFCFLFFIAVIFSVSACNSVTVKKSVAKVAQSPETLYVYEDGKMKLDSRYVDSKDVVIYPDGRGGEKAAIKVHFPLHSDFYRDSIIVVRVVNKFDESVTQNESENVDNIN
ncbi:MAG: hypothetical protein HND53_11540 [Proteobacteria bacterium]|nr:hypothetical protein [Pseudomonadota bacterium]NOG61125.1 hypothetical protein [Pseudomonadota bacterium]